MSQFWAARHAIERLYTKALYKDWPIAENLRIRPQHKQHNRDEVSDGG